MIYNDTRNYIRYHYNAKGVVWKASYYNSSNALLASYEFEYDSLGRLIRSRELDGSGNNVQWTEAIYDPYSRLSSQNWVLGSTSYSESYTYLDGADGTGALHTLNTPVGTTVTYNYDELNRLHTAVTTDTDSGTELFKTAYAYKAVSGNRTSNRVEFRNVRKPDGTLISGYKYSYDALGNITKIAQSESPFYPLVEYTYDDQNQLESETHYDGAGTGSTHVTKTYTYTYDTAGNIQTVSKNGSVIQNYTYSNGDWKDLLTGITVNGTSKIITYDEIGNPLFYYNTAGKEYELVWENGRQLAAFIGYLPIQERASYEYDAEGIRTSKLVDLEDGSSVLHTYITQNGRVVRETIGTGSTAKILDFIYDANGQPYAMKYYSTPSASPVTYYYVLNLQGDVVMLLDAGCSVVASYSYNAWGKLVSILDASGNKITNTNHISHLNPLRYRGYYYDTETGFYYLQSRYYDPASHRFINADQFEHIADAFAKLESANLYSYCNNDPVNYSDFTGEAPWSLVPDWGYIHRAVQAHIKEKYTTQGRTLVTEKN